jgi:N-acetylmuramoyl-L-alanine amidase
MSASLNNAGLELLKEETAPVPELSPRPPSPTDSMGHEALQALLAFAALHDQVRKRRVQTGDGGRSSAEDDWQVEHFLLDEVLQLVAERALAITGADGVAIAWAEGDAIVCRASAGTIAPDAGIRLDPNSGFSGECLVSGRIVRCDDADADPRVNLQACRRLGVRSMLAVPLSAKENVIGLIEAFSNEPYGFNDSDVRSLGLLAELILSAMKPEEEDRLREISRRVVPPATVEPEPIPAIAPAPEIAKVEAELPSDESRHSPAPAIAVSSAELASAEDSKSNIVAIPEQVPVEPERLKSPPPGFAVVAAVVLIAVALGAGVWWKLGHTARSVKASASLPTPAAPIVPPTTITTPATSAVVEPTTETDTSNDDESDVSPTTSEAAGVLPQITGIRHWSSAESSTVVIDMQDQVQYEAHRLPHPERIYFDLHDTTLAAGLTNHTIPVNDALLERIRVAQPMAGVTRVVLETVAPSDFSVSLEPNPYRLVVEVRKLGTKPSARAKIDLFAPAKPASTDQAAANQVTANQKPIDSIAPSSKPNPSSPTAAVTNEKQSAASLTALSAPAHTAVSPQKLRIVLDAGHGGWDLGTVGRKGLLEKDLTLDIVERLGQLIENRLGAEVIYTRKDDSYLPLEKRAEIANLAQAGLFVSVHANYSDFPSARGVETYYTNTYSSVKARTEEADEAAAADLKTVNWTNVDIREKVHESRRVAISVQRSLYAMLSANNPGLPNRGVKEAHYVVLTGTSMPAILAEVSFVSSPTDENNLQSSSYRQQIAEALYTGIAHYQASNRNVKLASATAKPTGR